MRGLASIVAGRRTKWLILVVWVIAAVAMSPLGLEALERHDRQHRVVPPSNAESTRSSGRSTTSSRPRRPRRPRRLQERGRPDARPTSRGSPDAQEIQAEPAKIPLVRSQPPVLPALVGPTSRFVSANIRSRTRSTRSRPTSTNVREWGQGDARHHGLEHGRHEGLRHRRRRLQHGREQRLQQPGHEAPAGDGRSWSSSCSGAIYRSVLVAITPLIVVFFAYRSPRA